MSDLPTLRDTITHLKYFRGCPEEKAAWHEHLGYLQANDPRQFWRVLDLGGMAADIFDRLILFGRKVLAVDGPGGGPLDYAIELRRWLSVTRNMDETRALELPITEALAMLKAEADRKADKYPDSDKSLIYLEAETWHLRHLGERGNYPAKGNQAITWLAKLLTRPGRAFSVAELCGDPDGKLAADGLLRGEAETTPEGVRAIMNRIAQLDDLTVGVGLSPSQQEEYADLLISLENAQGGKQIWSRLRKAHHNMASQIRHFIGKDKLQRTCRSCPHI
jgi:hypothetical protein